MLHCDYCKEVVNYEDGTIVEIHAVYRNKKNIIKVAHYHCWREVDKIASTM